MNTTLVLGLMMTGMNVGEPPPPSPVNFVYPCCQGHTPAGHFRRTDLISPYNVLHYSSSKAALSHLRESAPIIRYHPETFSFRFEGWKDRTDGTVNTNAEIPSGPPLVQTGAITPASQETPPKLEPTPASTVEKSVKLLGARSRVEPTSPMRATAPITAVVIQAPSVPAPEAPAFSLPFEQFESTPPMPTLPLPALEPEAVEVATMAPVVELMPAPSVETLPESEAPIADVWEVVYATDPNTGEPVARIVTPGQEPTEPKTEVATSETPTAPAQPWEAAKSEQGPVFRMSGAPLWLDSIP